MDPRQLKTRAALVDAIVTLADTTPLDAITVTALSEAAGITRDTFYRHAQSPTDLLASVLSADLDAILASNSHLPVASANGDSVFRRPTEQVVAHVAARAPLYRSAMQPRLDADIRNLLVAYMAAGLAAHLEAHPEIAPLIGGAPPTPAGRRMLVAYAAAGTVGALEEWLETGDLTDQHAAVEGILAAAPEWWQLRPTTLG
ncbi:TetR/AcrR family transcriptional regulator [Herbiconiux sp. P15]|uniref:TetR/AcrR family transcriptional regulator n=1 Tax=Herbiconiux liukaitaii TaxID=3342799 RepID=UPI0035B7F0FA